METRRSDGGETYKGTWSDLKLRYKCGFSNKTDLVWTY